MSAEKILLIGAGPIVIGQGCEFDYSGTQACKALKKLGFEVILINPNPATIMTDIKIEAEDGDQADVVYIEPINIDILEQIIKKHRPQYLLPTVGGQTGLNAALDLEKQGILNKYNVQMLSVTQKTIQNAEDRKIFAQKMNEIGLKCPKSFIAKSLEDAEEIRKKIGLPAIIRPSFTLGGEGGGIAYNIKEFQEIVSKGLQASSTDEVQIDQSVIGWKEIEYEVIKDIDGNKMLICTIENLEPMGVHTGDSITCAPMLTISNKEAQAMRDAAFKILDVVGVIAGGANVQFAVNPVDGEILVVEMNPRVSRSSALASKATGFPIAKISAQLAVGKKLTEIKNEYLNGISAALEPTIDYIVVKIPKFNFKKFSDEQDILSSSMKSIGEAMAIGRSFEEALQKSLVSLESHPEGLTSLTQDPQIIKDNLQIPSSKRILFIADALRQGFTVNEICQLTLWDKWFVERIENIIEHEKFILQHDHQNWQKRQWFALKKAGLTDLRIANLINQYYQDHSQNNPPITANQVHKIYKGLNIDNVYKKIDSCAAEFATNTQYHYSSFENCIDRPAKCESITQISQKKVIIIGSGPNRIGQGIEFDYSCVQACLALKKMNIQAIMINSNPSTVSTDFDTADKLYFEPLDYENVRNIIEKEQDNLLGIITQFGGQTPLKLLKANTFNDYNVLGTSTYNIDLAEDRDSFGKLIKKLNLQQVKNVICFSIEEIWQKIINIQFPIIIRPSYVIGGRAMSIIYNKEELNNYIETNYSVLHKSDSILIDEFLYDAKELDVEIIGDGEDFVVLAIMEHIEKAGIHSGDSTAILPTFSIDQKIIDQIKDQSIVLAKAMKIKGLLNIQFAVQNNQIFILEANPRSSRTIPFVAKALKINIVAMATKILLGQTLKDLNFLETPKNALFAVKRPIFPFARFNKSNPILGPEMKSTGEVMGIDENFDAALAKAFNAWKNNLPISGNILMSVDDQDKAEILEIAQEFHKLGFNIYATIGTAKFLQSHNLPVKEVKKMSAGRPNILDLMLDLQINLIINTPSGNNHSMQDGFQIRTFAVAQNITYATTVTGIAVILRAIKYIKNNKINIHRI